MRKPILIAECCQNHNGNREVLKRMIHEATDAGADYVKIQTLRSREITFRERFEKGLTDTNGIVRAIKRPYAAEVERLAKLDLTPDDEAWFVDECLRAGVAPMTTVFTRAAARDVKDMGYEAIKIASYDCKSFPLLRDVKEWWSTIFVSTGATYDSEIERAAEILQGSDYTFLHCVTIYPTPMDEMHLRRMGYLRRFTSKVGFSDHSAPVKDNLWASKVALALGASCVERHFTVLDASETRDGPVSVTPEMIRELRVFANMSRVERMEIVSRNYPNWERSLGQSQRKLSDAELLNRDYYAGRVASIFDAKAYFNWEDVVLPPV